MPAIGQGDRAAVVGWTNGGPVHTTDFRANHTTAPASASIEAVGGERAAPVPKRVAIHQISKRDPALLSLAY